MEYIHFEYSMEDLRTIDFSADATNNRKEDPISFEKINLRTQCYVT